METKKPRGTQRGSFTVSMGNMSPRQDASLRVRKDGVVIALVRSKQHSNLKSWCRNNPQSPEAVSLREQMQSMGFTLQDVLTILS